MENKKERRFRLLDAAIILLALFAALGVWQRDNLKDLFEKEDLDEETKRAVLYENAERLLLV